jgi:N-acylneuraminate cytidylyltransferase/CMP-N,N'-diacetyllegionaminic acid synthase
MRWPEAREIPRPDETKQRPPYPISIIIPARGGSKGLARKNARLLCGKPLISYTIEAALKSRFDATVAVTTDDEELSGIAREYPSVVAIDRPTKLASDRARLDHVVNHAVKSLKGMGLPADSIVVLHPTSPFRTPRLLDFLLGKLMDGYNPVLTVRDIPARSRRFIVSRDGLSMSLESLCLKQTSRMRSYGLFSGCRPHLVSSTPYAHFVEDEIELIDIDYQHQLALAEHVIHNRLFDFDLR